MLKTTSSICIPEFEEYIAPPTSPREIDYGDSELLASRIEKTREKLKQKYPTCNLPQIATKLIQKDENVLIEYDNTVNYCQSYSNDYYNQFARYDKEPIHRTVSPDVQPSWRRYLQGKLKVDYFTTPFPPRGLLHSRIRSTRLSSLEAKHSSLNFNTNLQMQVPHKGGNNPMRRPLNNGYKRGTDTEKVVHQKEALTTIFPQNRNTTMTGTKKDGSQSILYEVKKNGLTVPHVPNYRSNVGNRQKSTPMSVTVTKLCDKKKNLCKNQTRSTLLPRLQN